MCCSSVSESQRLFSHSPRSRHLLRDDRSIHGGRRRSYHNLVEHEYPASCVTNRPTTQHSIYTLHSNRTSPLPSVDNELPNITVPTFTEISDDVLLRNPGKRRLVEAGTRSIAAKANTRRLSKQQSDEINNIRQKQASDQTKRLDTNKTFVSINSTPQSEHGDVTTPHSRLAQRGKPVLPSIDKQVTSPSVSTALNASGAQPKKPVAGQTRVQQLRRVNAKRVAETMSQHSSSSHDVSRHNACRGILYDIAFDEGMIPRLYSAPGAMMQERF